MKTEYDTQAESFLTDNGLKLRITLSDSKPAPWSPAGHHYRVTLSAPGRKRVTFDFWDSLAAEQAGTTPSPYSILACLSGEVTTPDTFEDYCDTFGENPDSLKARQTWKRCHSFAQRLRAFFTPAELDQLSEIQ